MLWLLLFINENRVNVGHTSAHIPFDIETAYPSLLNVSDIINEKLLFGGCTVFRNHVMAASVAHLKT